MRMGKDRTVEVFPVISTYKASRTIVCTSLQRRKTAFSGFLWRYLVDGHSQIVGGTLQHICKSDPTVATVSHPSLSPWYKYEYSFIIAYRSHMIVTCIYVRKTKFCNLIRALTYIPECRHFVVTRLCACMYRRKKKSHCT